MLTPHNIPPNYQKNLEQVIYSFAAQQNRFLSNAMNPNMNRNNNDLRFMQFRNNPGHGMPSTSNNNNNNNNNQANMPPRNNSRMAIREPNKNSPEIIEISNSTKITENVDKDTAEASFKNNEDTTKSANNSNNNDNNNSNAKKRKAGDEEEESLNSSQILQQGLIESLQKASEQDECTLFCSTLAKHLKKVPEEKRLRIEIDILEMVYKSIQA